MSLWRFVGDPHVGFLKALVGRPRALDLHRRYLRDQFVAAQRDGCKFIVVLGDIFDWPFPDQDEQLLVMNVLAEFDSLRIIVMLGNHDVHDASHSSLKLLRRLPGVGALRHVQFFVDPAIVTLDGLRVAVIPWRKKFAELRRAGSADLAFIHDTVSGATYDTGHRVPEGKGVSPSLLRGLPTVGGHLHTPHRVGNIRYVGTYCSIGFEETGPKYITTMSTSEEVKFMRDAVKNPPWRLKTVVFDPHNPPECDDPNTLYRVDISRGRPGPRWLVERPNVVRTFGGRREAGYRHRDLQQRVAAVMTGGGGESDRELLLKYLHQHSKVDVVTRAAALRIHDSLEKRLRGSAN